MSEDEDVGTQQVVEEGAGMETVLHPGQFEARQPVLLFTVPRYEHLAASTAQKHAGPSETTVASAAGEWRSLYFVHPERLG